MMDYANYAPFNPNDPATKVILEHKRVMEKAIKEQQALADKLFEEHKKLYDRAKAAADKAKEHSVELRSCERMLQQLRGSYITY